MTSINGILPVIPLTIELSDEKLQDMYVDHQKLLSDLSIARSALWAIPPKVLTQSQIDVLKGLNCQDYNQIYELQSFLQSLRIQKEQEESIKRKMLVIVAEQNRRESLERRENFYRFMDPELRKEGDKQSVINAVPYSLAKPKTVHQVLREILDDNFPPLPPPSSMQ